MDKVLENYIKEALRHTNFKTIRGCYECPFSVGELYVKIKYRKYEGRMVKCSEWFKKISKISISDSEILKEKYRTCFTKILPLLKEYFKPSKQMDIEWKNF